MEKRIQLFLKQKAEISRQFMILETVLFVVLVMSLSLIKATLADSATVDVSMTVATGTLSISAPSDLAFNAGEVGQTTIANIITSDPITIGDTRGNLDGWAVTGYFNNNFLNSAETAQMDINNDATQGSLFWYPGNMIVENSTGNNDGVNKGINGSFNGVGASEPLTLATSNNSHADNGAGAFNLFNLEFKYTIPVGSIATAYTTELRLTII